MADTYSLEIGGENEYISNKKLIVSKVLIETNTTIIPIKTQSSVKLINRLYPITVVTIDALAKDYSDVKALRDALKGTDGRDKDNNTLVITKDGATDTWQVLCGSVREQIDVNTSNELIAVILTLMVDDS